MSARLLAALALTAGCGRFAFDPTATGDASPADAQPRVWTLQTSALLDQDRRDPLADRGRILGELVITPPRPHARADLGEGKR